MRQYLFGMLVSGVVFSIISPTYGQFFLEDSYLNQSIYKTISTGWVAPTTTSPPTTTEEERAECSEELYQCNKGRSENTRKVGNTYFWSCYIAGIPNSLVNCSFDGAECGDTKFTCNAGTVQGRDAGNNPKTTNIHTWTCATDDEEKSCSSPIEWCGEVELEPGQECCAGRVLEENEFCCKESTSNEQQPGTLIGPSEVICNTEKQHQCWQRKTCSNSDGEEVFGEDGNPDPNSPDFASCNRELVCAKAIVHSCDRDRPNRNCQNECLADPKPAFCNTIIDGVCSNNGCLFGTGPIAIPGLPNNWLCVGSPADDTTEPDTPPGADALCGLPPTDGECGIEPNDCKQGKSVDLTDTKEQELWMCEGTNPEAGGQDDYCSKMKPVDGICEWINIGEQGGCFQGDFNDIIPDTPTEFLWECTGRHGGRDALCKLLKPKDGACGNEVFECNPGFLANVMRVKDTFYWDCLGGPGGKDAFCEYTCDIGQIALGDGTCGTDLCTNIDGNQLNFPQGITRDPDGVCTCTNGAQDPLTCTDCPTGTILNAKGECTCENGALNPPECTIGCGTASRTYSVSELSFDGTFCQSPYGLDGGVIPVFPGRGGTSGWVCVGPGKPITCGATREDCVLPEKWNGVECVIPDLCKNIEGTQTDIPPGLTRDVNGVCTCINGAQDPLACTDCPTGTILNAEGECTCENGANNPPSCTVGCGPASRAYRADELSFDGTFCQSPYILDVGIPPIFPERGGIEGWKCVNSNAGITVSCEATREDCILPEVWDGTSCKLPAICGEASGEYISPNNSYRGAFCEQGEIFGGIPNFPTPGNPATWECR